MLQLSAVDILIAGEPLLEGLELTIHKGDRIGIVGRNGCGKSTLFALLRGAIEPDRGSMQRPDRLRITWLDQFVPDTQVPVLEYVLAADSELDRVRRALARAERDGDGTAQAQLHASLEALDGYTAEARAGGILDGLGFSSTDLARPVSDFSGGWRVRLNLCRALFDPGDLLLLDEPTNHLDLDTVLWLQRWLRQFPGTLVIVSHDRDFLDAVARRIVHIEHRRLTAYVGDYSSFVRQRSERLAQQTAQFEKQERKRADLQKFVDRFRYKASKAKQAQSRLKAMDRLTATAPMRAQSPYRFAFPTAPNLPDPIVSLIDMQLGYDAHVVLHSVEVRIHPGSRIGLLGRNGAGKSTLVKALAGTLAPQRGERLAQPQLSVGYFDQLQVDALRPDLTPLTAIRDQDPDADTQKALDFLGGYGFNGRRAEEPLGQFSGGERARLALALLAWRQPALLLLDEPTNHLDLETREALVEALQSFDGALVIVSHDRFMIEACVDEFTLVDAGRVASFDGDLDDYERFLTRRGQNGAANAAAAPPQAAPPTRPSGREERQAGKRAAAQRRAARKPLRDEQKQLERHLERLGRKLAEIEQALADGSLYDPGRKDEMTDLMLSQGRLRAEIEAAEERWLELSELLEDDD